MIDMIKKKNKELYVLLINNCYMMNSYFDKLI